MALEPAGHHYPFGGDGFSDTQALLLNLRAGEGGARGTRTPDPLHAMQVLSQLSYGPGPLNGSRRAYDNAG